MGDMIADQLAEDDGPVVLERRRSRHGNYYEEIPPEPEPEPVPVEPEHVPETMAAPPVWPNGGTALDYIKGLESVTPYLATAVYSPINVGINPIYTTTGSYSISLNDVIGAGKGYQPVSTGFGSIEGVYDPPANMQTGDYIINDNGSISVQTPNGPMYALPDGCEHPETNRVTHPKHGFQKVKCKDCGHQWVEKPKF